MDAFLEVYHIKGIHPNTVGASLDHRGAVMGLLATCCIGCSSIRQVEAVRVDNFRCVADLATQGNRKENQTI